MLYGLENDPDFEHINTRLLITCPSSGSDQGGLFLLDFENNTFEKLYTGSCSGMTIVNDRLFIASDDNELITMDQKFRVIQKKQYSKLDFHDISKFDDHVVLVVETATNTIGCYNTETLTRSGEIRFSAEDKDIHHINDIWLDGHTLYVSMFSPYGKWYMNPMHKNGGIVAIDLTDFHPNQQLHINPENHVVVKDLYMPHTVMMHQNELAYCDSMSFRVIAGNTKPIQLSGFTRGLAITENTIFIGQSRMRHVLRIPHEFSNCCLDGGIYVYDPKYRISRFVPLPAQQVYQILSLDQNFI
ncbi:DUF4915 domain-containing protein [Gracilibacillus salitolerans]|uniref:DUF4915 domain-containing protein n=1 Tax=Gracilibacillus salitolerans TaxID=2663022 RepID=A0A5Q2TSW8_9BACI|nr:DUF4915 domain-containing protein [Gracilibacillus salitolerans]QGH36750.1 DUF4915 domain-containing protein [Gracilibacillus salitolerans]